MRALRRLQSGFYRFGGIGRNALVRCVYSRYSGLVFTNVFSSSATPDTFINSVVIIRGLITVHQPPGVADAIKKKPHHRSASSK